MAADLINFGLSAAQGGIAGLIGTGLGRVMGFFERKLDNAHELKRWEHELKLHEANRQARIEEIEQEIALAAQAGSWAGLEASFAADAALGKGSQWVINTLRLVRPVITLLLWIITAAMFFVTQDDEIAKAAVFAATAATLWWFGDRAPRPDQFNGVRK